MKIFVVGDYCPQNRVEKKVESGDYAFLDEIKLLIDKIQPDIRICNFETTICDETTQPIEKSGPNLKSTPKSMLALKYAGFNVVTLANNHILDYGDKGIINVVNEANRQGIRYVGVGKNLKESKSILYITGNDGKIMAIINCCEHEYSIAGSDSFGANPLDIIDVCHQIGEAKENADYVVAIVHGGHEHCQHPSMRMKKTYRFFVEAGADAVINHHQHCYLGYETYMGKPIFYGLGNFCFDKYSDTLPKTWAFGYAVEIDFDKDISYKTYPFEQCGESAIVHLLENRSFFDTKIEELNAIIGDDKKLIKEVHSFYEANPIVDITTPQLKGHWCRLKPYVEKLIAPHWYFDIRDYIMCESHKDRLEYELLIKTRKNS